MSPFRVVLLRCKRARKKRKDTNRPLTIKRCFRYELNISYGHRGINPQIGGTHGSKQA